MSSKSKDVPAENENDNGPAHDNANERPAFHVVSVIEGTNQPKVLERSWKPGAAVITEQTVYGYSTPDGQLVSKTSRRKLDDGKWEILEHEDFDEFGRIVRKVSVAPECRTTVYEYPSSGSSK